jgi:hypothetical protein
LALVSLDEERRAFGGGRLVVGISNSLRANPKSEARNPKQVRIFKSLNIPNKTDQVHDFEFS